MNGSEVFTITFVVFIIGCFLGGFAGIHISSISIKDSINKRSETVMYVDPITKNKSLIWVSDSTLIDY